MKKEIEIIKTVPSKNIYFAKETAEFNNMPENTEGCVVNVFPEVKHQEILGFGGAFTESSAYNYSLMSKEQKEEFIKLYFDKKSGIGYNFGRTCIASCDFALDIYSYVKEGDKTLETFSIERDKRYIIPLIKDAMKVCNDELVLFASPWSPPAYMKTNKSVIEGGSVVEEYKAIWALYYAKYIKAYLNEGIEIKAISVQNEPIAVQTWESCYYSAEDEKSFIRDYLVPALDNEELSDIKIIIWDHNKERTYDRARDILADKKVNERVWAVGHHWYSGEHFEGVKLVNEVLKKPTICTEYCCTYNEDNVNTYAEMYAKEMIGNINNGDIASCDWNILLDNKGGPYHNRTRCVENKDGVISYEQTDSGCFAPIIFNADEGKMILTPIYYYIGHFSKFVDKGAKVIATTKYTSQIETVSFLNDDNTCVTVIVNFSDDELPINIRLNNTCTGISIEPHSIMTVKL